MAYDVFGAQRVPFLNMKYSGRFRENQVSNIAADGFLCRQDISNQGIYCAEQRGPGLLSGNSPPTWWRHQMETQSALLAICAGNSQVTGEIPAQRPVTRSFDNSLIARLSKRLSKQSWGWWFEMPSHPLWRHCYDLLTRVLWIVYDVIKWKHSPRYWPLCGEFTGHRWIPRTKASDAELW